jgi:hypothetical protein
MPAVPNLHPSEHADLERDEAWSRDLARPSIVPGSAAEQEALDAIDRAREAEEKARGTTRKQASQKAWRRWGGRLGL